jgi:CBS domain-containing protein
MRVGEIMTHHPYCIGQDEPIQHAAQRMKTHNVGALPVCDGDRLTGIITDRDIAIECISAGDHGECWVKSHMTADPISTSPEMDALEALDMMAREQVRRLCVTEGDKVVGIVSLGDLAVRLSEEAEVAKALKQISQPVRSD